MTIVRFRLDPTQGKTTTASILKRGTTLVARRAQGSDCKFSTCYDVSLWPIEITSVSWLTGSLLSRSEASRQNAAAIQIELTCHPDVSFRNLDLSSLRFYLNGPAELTHIIYELLFNYCHSIRLIDPDSGPQQRVFELDPGSLSPVGFKEDEGMYPAQARSFSGYQILQDYFALPEKYFFLDLGNLEASRKNSPVENRGLDCHRRLNIQFLLSAFDREDWRPALERGLSKQAFCLGTTPAINLFSYTTDAIPMRQTNYQVLIPVPSRVEIFSVEEVYSQSQENAAPIPFRRFFGTHAGQPKSEKNCFWHAVRRRSRKKEGASEYFLSLLDGKGVLTDPLTDTVFAKLKCTNGSAPSEERAQFVIESSPEVQHVDCLRPPTKGSAAASSSQSVWRLVSQLSLNYLSLVDDRKESLQWLLHLHNLSGSDLASESIKGIVHVCSQPHFARVSSEHGMAFVRGKLVDLTLDEVRFVGSGVYLFASIIERFLSLYTSLNSFSALRLRTLQRGEKIIASWPARAGGKAVL